MLWLPKCWMICFEFCLELVGCNAYPSHPHPQTGVTAATPQQHSCCLSLPLLSSPLHLIRSDRKTSLNSHAEKGWKARAKQKRRLAGTWPEQMSRAKTPRTRVNRRANCDTGGPLLGSLGLLICKKNMARYQGKHSCSKINKVKDAVCRCTRSVFHVDPLDGTVTEKAIVLSHRPFQFVRVYALWVSVCVCVHLPWVCVNVCLSVQQPQLKKDWYACSRG